MTLTSLRLGDTVHKLLPFAIPNVLCGFLDRVELMFPGARHHKFDQTRPNQIRIHVFFAMYLFVAQLPIS
jgi:hypothetical protein